MTHREVQNKREGLGLLFMYKQYTESNRNSIKFSLLNADKEQLALFWLRSWLTDTS